MKFFNPEDGSFAVENFPHACDVVISAQEMLVDNASYPTEKIAANSYKFRPLGLGYANLGALLMATGIPYDSDEGRAYSAAITSLMCGEAYLQSSKIAAELEPFAGYEPNESAFLDVIGMHRDAANQVPVTAGVPTDLLRAQKAVWDAALESGKQYGYKNGQVTVLAPTGTIGFMMDCDTTGVEPDLALVKYKKLVGGGTIKIVNNTVPLALKRLGYDEAQVNGIVDYVDEKGTIEGAPGFKPEHLPVFDCSFRALNGTRSIHYMGHVRMMGAVQPFLSGAISKTVNLPTDATPDEIATVYMEGWKQGLKAIAIYRDGCKRTQPLSTNLGQATSDGKALPQIANVDPLELLSPEERRLVEALRARKTRPAGPPMANRYKLPDERASFTHKFSIGGHEGYLTVGLYPDGTPGEIFVRMAKEGSVIAGLMDSFATAISLALQHGVPLHVLIEKFKGTRFEPSGFTGNQEIPIATSIMDYLFRWLAIRFPVDGPSIVERHPAARAAQLDLPKVPLLSKDFVSVEVKSGMEPAIPVEVKDRAWVQETDAPPCHECGTLMVRNGACHKCPNCGSTSGCS
jgi:ribonucleoside-diphosphate reductase alpha chain